jgi:hypothetical protein
MNTLMYANSTPVSIKPDIPANKYHISGMRSLNEVFISSKIARLLTLSFGING